MNAEPPLAAEFLLSASQLQECPSDQIAEVAFVGRSNSGKSSTINCLTGIRQLARVSKTPGRTQLINFFVTTEGFRLVDLPGYGYARANKRRQLEWGKAVDDYLQRRANLRGVVLVMDSRHPLQSFDVQMIQWSEMQELRLLVLLNKADKLKQRERVKNVRLVEEKIEGQANIDLLLFSAVKKTGMHEALVRIRTMANG